MRAGAQGEGPQGKNLPKYYWRAFSPHQDFRAAPGAVAARARMQLQVPARKLGSLLVVAAALGLLGGACGQVANPDASPMVQVKIVIVTAQYANEIHWSLDVPPEPDTDAYDLVKHPTDIRPYDDTTNYTIPVNISSGAEHTFYFEDTFGDGWVDFSTDAVNYVPGGPPGWFMITDCNDRMLVPPVLVVDQRKDGIGAVNMGDNAHYGLQRFTAEYTAECAQADAGPASSDGDACSGVPITVVITTSTY
eukprot:SAG22_NODE_3996_length_1433_cov_1.536732_1_plen_248_part_10